MARNSFAGRVLAAIKTLENGTTGFRAADLIAPLHLKSREQARKISIALGDHFKAGRLVKIETGLFRLPRYGENQQSVDQRPQPPAAPLIKDRMWSVLRSLGTVTVADLQMLAGASAEYAKEYLRMLAKREIVRALPQPGNQPSKYQFIKREMVQPPSDDKKADRLKAQRAKKRTAAIASLDESVRVLFCAMGQLRRAHKEAILTLDEEA